MEYGVDILGLYFLTGDHSPDRFYESSYSAWLVLLSYAFAFFGSYVGLVISQQVAAAKNGAAQAAWIAAGAAAMGGGVWSMHFVGMIAYALPFSVGYDITLTSLSVIPSICASAIVLFIISRQQVSWRGLVIGGVLTGAGIGTMHFIGMSAMRAETSMGYDPVLFGLSILVAVLLACLALSVKFRLDSLKSQMASRWANVIGGAVMGLAISGMHYVAMAAARFFPGDLCLAPGATIQADCSPLSSMSSAS